MTRVVVDQQMTEKLHGLGQFLEFCDEAGNVLGTFQPNESSPAFRAWLRDLDPGISEEEIQRRIHSDKKHSMEEVLARLQGRPA